MPFVVRSDLDTWRNTLNIYRADPNLYARYRIGINPTKQQRRLLTAIQPPGAKVTVRAGHSVGKTGAAAIALLWMLETNEFSRIACTAPSAHQLRDVLWAEVGKMIRHSDMRSQALGMPKAFWLSNLVAVTQDRIGAVGFEQEWFATARTARKESPDALQGLHASEILISADGGMIEEMGDNANLLFIIDEAPGVDDKIFEVAEGALATPDSRLLMLGNPTRADGYFYNSHTRNRANFTTLHFPCSESPLTPPGYRERLVQMWGEGSNIVRVRADGDFPIINDDALIALEWVEQAIARDAPAPNTADIRLGVDVARFGSDRTVFTCRQGAHLQDIVVMAKLDTMEVAGRVMDYCQRHQVDSIFVDAVGLGAGVADRLRELNMPVTDVQSAENPPERRKDIESVEMSPWKLRDHLYLEMMRWFRDDHPSFEGVDTFHAETLAGEASSLTYKFNSSGKVVLEGKADFKKRLGGDDGRSPDIADSLALTFAPDSGNIWLRL